MDGQAKLITVGVCDAAEITRVGIARALARHGVDVVAEAGDRAGALQIARSARASVMLVDLNLPPAPESAFAVIGAVRDAGTIPIAVGIEGAPEGLFTALRAGAAGYLTKDLPSSAWAGAIAAAVRGETPISRAMTALLVERYRQEAVRTPVAAIMPSDCRLTRRELDVLRCVAQGLTNRRVAAELSISVETVRSHVSNILAKLEAPSRTAAAARYHELTAAAR
ncbi:MAG TPA: response regulator transcription factor [Gaiellales bacterium]|nr:response regulator transcription factor [Gaiellales bacterium]